MDNVRVVLCPLASAIPLGFFAVGAGSMTLAGLDLGWIPRDEQLEVGLILVVLAALPLPIAAVLAFLARDAAVGAAMGVQAVAWGIQGLVPAVAPTTRAPRA